MLFNKLLRIVITVLSISIASNILQAKELIVSAAASLNNAFQELATKYEAKHPGTKILFNFAASGTLLQQIDKGAPTDVFASADQDTMNQAQQKQLIIESSRENFINNTLVVITPIYSVLDIRSLNELDQSAIKKIAIGNPAYVPAGSYTQQVLMASKQWQALNNKFIYTQNVRQALDYVSRSEVEAGFVYGSDAAIMKDKVKVVFTVPLTKPVSYPIAIVARSEQQQLAQDFIAYTLTNEAQQILIKYGFQSRD